TITDSGGRENVGADSRTIRCSGGRTHVAADVSAGPHVRCARAPQLVDDDAESARRWIQYNFAALLSRAFRCRCRDGGDRDDVAFVLRVHRDDAAHPTATLHLDHVLERDAM